MKWPFGKRQVSGDVNRAHRSHVSQGLHEARKARRDAERKLETEQAVLVRPLREMITENHVTERLDKLIEQSGRRRREGE